MKIHIWFSLLFLSLLAWFFMPTHKAHHSKTWVDKYPAEYMKQVAVWTYTEEGQLKNHLSAKYWAYIPKQQSSELTIPHLTVYKPDQTIWHIDAKRGNVSQPTLGSIDQVELFDTVILKRPGSATVVPLLLETEILRYQPKNQYAETDEIITLTKPDFKITGTGMRAYLDKNSVELLKNVKTHFISNP